MCYYSQSGQYIIFNDYQPASFDENGLILSGPSQRLHEGFIYEDTTECFDGEITGPAGLEAFRLEVWSEGSTPIDFAELWINVAP